MTNDLQAYLEIHSLHVNALSCQNLNTQSINLMAYMLWVLASGL